MPVKSSVCVDFLYILIKFQPILPSIFNKEDASQLLQGCLKSLPQACVYCDTIVTSDSFVQACSKPFKHIMAVKADKV